MGPEPRPELMALPAAAHGGSTDPQVLDFSTGVSPLAPPAALLDAIAGADLTRYPHPTALPVRQALAALHDVPPEGIVAGAGSVELIWALARAFGGPGRAGLVVTPAFSEYAPGVAGERCHRRDRRDGRAAVRAVGRGGRRRRLVGRRAPWRSSAVPRTRV